MSVECGQSRKVSKAVCNNLKLNLKKLLQYLSGPKLL